MQYKITASATVCFLKTLYRLFVITQFNIHAVGNHITETNKLINERLINLFANFKVNYHHKTLYINQLIDTIYMVVYHYYMILKYFLKHI